MMPRVVLMFVLLCVAGCWRDDMADDAHYKPEEASPIFPDGKLARPLVVGTVPRGGHTVTDTIYAVTAPTTAPATSFPSQLDRAGVERGKQQYEIFCAVCHGATGDGNGMIVQRGFPHPPSYYLDRLRKAPPGHFYDVITHGHGAMYSYADRIEPEDRWRIVGYIRALQLSDPTNDGLATTPPEQRK